MTKISKRIGFIGSGNMGEAMIAAILKARLFDADRIWTSDIRESRLAEMQERFGIHTTLNNVDLYKACDVVVLAVKPQQMIRALEDLEPLIRREVLPRKLVISIAAGIPLNRLESLLYSYQTPEAGNPPALIRVMPNTPALVLSAMSAMATNPDCSEDDINTAKSILGAMGSVIEVREDQLDAVTALSGSGPAYFFYFIEAMIQAGIQLGFTPSVSGRLAVETAAGAVKMLMELGESPEALRKKVTSPGGTTEAAVSVFNTRSIHRSIVEGILAAEKRSKELSQA